MDSGMTGKLTIASSKVSKQDQVIRQPPGNCTVSFEPRKWISTNHLLVNCCARRKITQPAAENAKYYSSDTKNSIPQLRMRQLLSEISHLGPQKLFCSVIEDQLAE